MVLTLNTYYPVYAAGTAMYIVPITTVNYTPDPPSFYVQGLIRDLGYGNANVAVGYSVGFPYLAWVTGSSFNSDISKLEPSLAAARQFSFPILVHLNGHRFDDYSANIPFKTHALNFMYTQDGTPITNLPEWSDPVKRVGAALFTLNVFNKEYRTIKERNVKQAAARLKTFMDNNPRLFVGVSMDSEVSMCAASGIGGQLYDYNPETLIQWKYYLSGSSGSFTQSGYQNPYSVGGRLNGQGKNLNLSQLSSRYNIQFTGWNDNRLIPKAAVGTLNRSIDTPQVMWNDWLAFKAHMVNTTLRDMAGWIQSQGIPASKIFTHQVSNMDQPEGYDYVFCGVTKSSTNIPPYSFGYTSYGPEIADNAYMQAIYNLSPVWGIFEWNPMTNDGTLTVNALNNMFTNHGRAVAPNMYYPPGSLQNVFDWEYNIRNKPAVMAAIRSFIQSKKGPTNPGWLDFVTASQVIGWSCDTTDPNRPANIELVLNANTDSERVIGVYTANGPRNPGVDIACGSVDNQHGFSIPTPQYNSQDTFSVRVIRSDGVKELIGNSGLHGPANANLIGDLNGDHIINYPDLQTLLSKMNKSDSQGDFNHTGRVDIYDMKILMSRYGNTL